MMLMLIIPLIKYVLFVNTFLFLSSLVPGAQFLRKLNGLESNRKWVVRATEFGGVH